MASPSPSCIAATLFLLSNLLQLLSTEAQAGQNCPSAFECSPLGTLGYPFTTIFRPKCGLYAINCTGATPTIGLIQYDLWFDVLHSSSNNKSFLLGDPFLLHTVSCKCNVFDQASLILPNSSSASFKILWTQILWKCSNKVINESGHESLRLIRYCGDHGIYQNHFLDEATPPNCSKVDYPRYLIVELSYQCLQCVSEGGRCQDLESGRFHCIKRKGRRKLILLLGLGILGGIVALLILGLVFWHIRKIKLKLESAASASRSISADPARTSKMYFSLPIFSYNELEEATNNFDSAMELGDGGFGTVYYGKLKDGREVAVKRLYERNYRRLEQFMNEIEILNRLRHQNLVSLYGCTSRRSRELLLVYEYVANATVAEHLHGDRAKCGTLTWPIRMSIAIETARALSYLHASDIIHRDVKTNNILLDNCFRVKIADFGLSRLFPTDVTHISTVPQGTPGYLDPEYHQCYQLTGKSDVYSFGVVLLELISSLPAVDVNRKEDEINLSCYAMKRIQSCAFSELVDPRLGFELNFKVRRMTTLVAELAFRCLQHKKEFRPSMDEVLEDLMNIESADYEVTKAAEKDENNGKSETQTEADYAWLLRHTSVDLPSPKSVIHKWSSSKSITPATSR